MEEHHHVVLTRELHAEGRAWKYTLGGQTDPGMDSLVLVMI